MRYATESRDRKYVEGYGFLLFARNLASSQLAKRAKDALVKQGKEAATNAGKRALCKTAEAIGNLVGQKIADKITKKSKVTKKPDQSVVQSVTQQKEFSPEEIQKILRELDLLSEV